MSAWLCSQDHLNLIVAAHPSGGDEDAFKMLLAENLRSLRSRYGSRIDEPEAEAEISASYRYEPIGQTDLVKRVFSEADERTAECYPLTRKSLTPTRLKLQIIKACDSYDYQACETDDYAKTPAAAYVEQVRRANRVKSYRKADYEGALWAF